MKENLLSSCCNDKVYKKNPITDDDADYNWYCGKCDNPCKVVRVKEVAK